VARLAASGMVKMLGMHQWAIRSQALTDASQCRTRAVHRLDVGGGKSLCCFSIRYSRAQRESLGVMKMKQYADTVVVLTINYADSGSGGGLKRPPRHRTGNLKSLGSGGSMVARLKLKGIDGRAPPGVD